MLEALREMELGEQIRRLEQGLGAPIVAVKTHEANLVWVGNRMFPFDPNKNFQDFLYHYLWRTLGPDWIAEERLKTVDQHWIVRLLNRVTEAIDQAESDSGNGNRVMSGAELTLLKLAYNLYLIEHNSPPNEGLKRVTQFVRKIKHQTEGSSLGILFETHVSAMFLLSGFDIEYLEEEKGAKTYAEFNATFKATGKKFTVEAKARVLDASASMTDKAKTLRVRTKLLDALKKDSEHRRIVLIGYMLPELMYADNADSWEAVVRSEIKHMETAVKEDGTEFDPAYVFVANYAYQTTLGYGQTEFECFLYGYKIPDFERPVTYASLLEYLDAKDRHFEVEALFESLKTHTYVPATFDGSIPEFEFGTPQEARLIIGKSYELEVQPGSRIKCTLMHAKVVEAERAAECVFLMESGELAPVKFPLSELSLNAWRRMPDLFFGSLAQPAKRPDSLLALAEFIFRAQRNTPRATLIERLAFVLPIERLNEMDHRELAAEFAQRLAVHQWKLINSTTQKPED